MSQIKHRVRVGSPTTPSPFHRYLSSHYRRRIRSPDDLPAPLNLPIAG